MSLALTEIQTIWARYQSVQDSASTGTTIARGEFVKTDTGGVVKCGADETGAIVGIAAEDEKDAPDGDVLVFHGKAAWVDIEPGSTVAQNDPVYLASATTVYADADAGTGAKAVGTAIAIDGAKALVRFVWHKDLEQADAL